MWKRDWDRITPHGNSHIANSLSLHHRKADGFPIVVATAKPGEEQFAKYHLPGSATSFARMTSLQTSVLTRET
jgi:hypothetical protein